MRQIPRSYCISKSASQPQIQSKKSRIEINPREKSPKIDIDNSDVSLVSSSSSEINRNQIIKTRKLPFTDHLKNLGHSCVYSKHDFCLIQWTCDLNFSVVKITEVGDPKIIKIDKEYPVKYDKKILRAKVKFVGSRSECESKLDSITSYEKSTNNHAKNKKTILTTQQCQNLVTNSESFDTSKFVHYEKKIKELEEMLKTKNKELSMIKGELEQKNNIILCYKNTYNESNVKRILDFSLNFIKLYGSRQDLTEIPFYSEGEKTSKYFLSTNYESVVLTREQKIELDKYVKSDDSDSSVFRKLIGTLIVEDEAWALRDRDFIKKDFKSEFFAAYDFISHKRPQFPMSVADNETRKMCNEIRKRLRDVGYKIETNDDKSLDQLPYKIISKPQVQHRALKRKGVFSEEHTRNGEIEEINDKETTLCMNSKYIEDDDVENKSNTEEENEIINLGKKCRRNRVYIEESDQENNN